MTDLRHAFRQLLKNPGFTVVAGLTLALAVSVGSASAQTDASFLMSKRAYCWA